MAAKPSVKCPACRVGVFVIPNRVKCPACKSSLLSVLPEATVREAASSLDGKDNEVLTYFPRGFFEGGGHIDNF